MRERVKRLSESMGSSEYKTSIFNLQCLSLFGRDGSVVPVSRYREHFTEIP